MTPAMLRTLIDAAASTAGLAGPFAAAIVRVESNGDVFAYRPEPRYRYFWDVARNRPFRAVSPDEVGSKVAPADFPTLTGSREQEWWAQQASWGLMQIMGAVAREEGFTAPFLTELVDPAANLTVGCRHLRGLVQWAGGDLSKAAAGYNAGRGGWSSSAGQQYAAKVIAAMRGAQ
jgi:soluble lytic murein transglycosylase-like protein